MNKELEKKILVVENIDTSGNVTEVRRELLIGDNFRITNRFQTLSRSKQKSRIPFIKTPVIILKEHIYSAGEIKTIERDRYTPKDVQYKRLNQGLVEAGI